MADTLESALEAMLEAGEEPAPEILERVKAFGARAIPRLIEIATSEEINFADEGDPRVFAPLHAIEILGELRAVEAVEPLLPLVAWDDDDWLLPCLSEFFGEIGEPAIAPLEGILADAHRTIYTHARASNSLVHIAQKHPTLRERVVATLVQYLEPAHTQTADHETRAGFIISDLCDLCAAEALPAIRRAFAEDRVDTQVISIDSVERKMQGLPLQESDESLEQMIERREREELELVLKCTECGRERSHKVGTLFVDLGTIERRERGEKTKYDEFIITRRIVCPKCGAVDKYKLGAMGQIALISDLVLRQERGKLSDPSSGRVRYIHFALSDGRRMHPREAIQVLRQEVAANPKDANLCVRLGQVLRFLGYLDEAAAEYRTALDLDPNNIEACLNLGTLQGVLGNWAEARAMLQRALALEPHLIASRKEHAENQAMIRERLAKVERGERLDDAVLTDMPLMEPVTAPAPSRPPALVPGRAETPPRVGRNDPCPCGSGKKYKHCHGR